MKKITETALLYRVNQLNEKLAMHEAAVSGRGSIPAAPEQPAPAVHGRGAPPAQTTTPPAQTTPAAAPHQTVLQAYNANIAKGMDKNAAWAAAQNPAGAQSQSGTAAKPVQSKPTAAAPAHAKPAAPAQAKSDPAVVKIQQDLIAKGYPLKADGIMGPKTQQAMDWQAQSDKRDAGLKATNNMDPSKPAPAAPTDPTQKAAYDAAVKNMDPNQTPAPAGAAAITPAFQSQQAPAPEKPEGVTVFPGTVTQQTAAQPSGGWDQNDPNTPAMFRNPLPGEPGMHESVSFENEDSLARIVQLVNW